MTWNEVPSEMYITPHGGPADVIANGTRRLRPLIAASPITIGLLLALSAGRCAATQVISASTIRDLRVAIDTARPYSIVELAAGTYRLADSAIVIGRKTGLTFRGQGSGVTILEVADGVKGGIELRDSLRDITVSDLAVRGVPGSPSRALGVFTDADASPYRSLRNIVVTRVVLRDLRVGIWVSTNCGPPDCHGGIDSVLISDNTLRAIRGTASWSGYGITTANVTNLHITGNRLDSVGRHSIYQSHTIPPDDARVLIADNLIVDHGQGTTGAIENSAVVVARSSGIVVARNLIVNSRNFALSVECNEDDPSRRIRNVQLIGNTVLGNHQQDLFLTALGTFVGWGNRYIHPRGMSRDTIVHLEASACGDGMGSMVEPPAWRGTTALAAGDAMLVLINGRLHRVVPSYFTDAGGYVERRDTATNWAQNFAGMSLGADKLFVVQNGRLHAVNPITLSYTVDPTRRWNRVDALVAYGRRVFVADGAVLYRVDPETWVRTAERSIDWSGTRGMVAAHDTLFVLRDACFYRVPVDFASVVEHGCYVP